MLSDRRPGGTPAILVVDDDPLSCRATARSLKGAFEVLTADSHDGAMLALELRHDIRAVVSDCRMGTGPSGIDLLKRARSSFPGVARITLSGTCDTSTLQELVSSGVAHAALSKPCAGGELLAVVAQTCGLGELPRAGDLTETPAPEERRAAPRHRIASMVWYQPVPAARGQPDAPGLGRSHDFSEIGLGLVVARPVPVGQTLLLELSRPPRARITAVAEVRHSTETEGYHRVGVRIIAIPPSDELSLRRLRGTAGGS